MSARGLAGIGRRLTINGMAQFNFHDGVTN
jgi:hypothetical protein